MKTQKVILSLLLIAVMMISLAGCDITNKKEETAKNTTPATKTYTDMAGRKVKLSANINKIVLVRSMDVYYMSAILGTEFDKKVVALGLNFKDSDIDGYKKYSEVFNMDRIKSLGSIYDDAISLESVVNLDPDLIIADAQFKSKSCVNKMIEAGLPVVFTDMNSDPFHGVQKSMLMLGKMLGKEDKVKNMVEDTNKKTDSVLARVDELLKVGTKRPTLYFECGNVTPTEIGGTRGDISDGWGYLWNKLGANNIGVGQASNPVNPEKVLTADPDVIVIGGANWDPKADIMRMGYYVTKEQVSEHLGEYVEKRAGWSDLSAIKNGRLYAVHFNYTVYPYNFCGVEAMAKFLFPDKFQDLNPEEDRREFFDKYMPVKYSGLFSSDWK
jgi:iron complex transport system substrate-binding protein